MKNKHAQLLGKQGGKANVDKHGVVWMKELSKKAVEAKKAKKSQNIGIV